MFSKKASLVSIALLVVSSQASAFRNCGNEDSEAWSAATSYTVGEVAFDDTTGLASGTETIYNYSNTYDSHQGECHVTYELNGSYVPGVEVFVLAGTRSNYSETCPPDLLRIEYPADLLLSFQMQPAQDGSAVVNRADSGLSFAEGTWQPGKAVFKTGELCSIF
jgi:hypothetical protein